MQAYMITLGDKIKAKRYDGQLDECRKFYELAIRNLPKGGASRIDMAAFGIICALIAGTVSYGIWG